MWDWLPEPTAAELEAMAAAAAATSRSRSRIAPFCARIVAAAIPGAKWSRPEVVDGDGGTEFSPSRRHRAGGVIRNTRRNSPWDSEGEWTDETVDEEEHLASEGGVMLPQVQERQSAAWGSDDPQRASGRMHHSKCALLINERATTTIMQFSSVSPCCCVVGRVCM